MDLAILKLVWALPGLYSIQPHVMTAGEVKNVSAYCRTCPGVKVLTHLEGLGDNVCEAWDHGGEERPDAKKVG